jgi:steroid delta-isomerase-like uncharacterized protein
VAIDDALRRRREEICVGHMTAENAHRFEEAIDRFATPRYEILATGEVYDGAAELGRLMHENVTAFPDFHYDPERLHHADDAIVVEGTFSGTHLGVWRGLPPTGRTVEFPMLIVFPFDGDRMLGERIYFDLSTALRQLGVAHDPNTVAGRLATALNHPLTVGRAVWRQVRTRGVDPGAVARGLPPGSVGWPVAGETLAFLRSPYAFLEERQRRHGNVFRSNVLGRNVAFLAGLEGAEAFYDPDNIGRADAHPFPLVDLFGGTNMEMFDGPTHVALKSMALAAFGADAIEGYLPDLRRLVASTLERLCAAGEFTAMREFRRLAIEAICGSVMGLEPGPATDDFVRDYGDVLAGITSIPLPAPGMPYARARAARDRILQRLRLIEALRRAQPGTDALSRMVTATAADGRTYRDDEAVLEAHHVVIAGFIVYALMGEVMRRLAEQPDLLERCADEIAAQLGDDAPTMDALDRLAVCTSVVMETKRLVPLVPLAFGRARRAFACEGYEIPAGWTVYLALHLLNRDPSVFKDPDRFDPARFGADRAEHRSHPMAFIPQGAEPPTGHRCLGLDYSTALVLTFLVELVRGYRWELPAQDLAYDWRRVPPEPRDGLRVRLRARAAVAAPTEG